MRIVGTVQGVGFRPHLHRLARRLSLTGVAGNDNEGVWCEIQGDRGDLDTFEERVTAEAPPLARIDSVRSHEVSVVEPERDFTVAPSADDASAVAPATVPPDVAPCRRCLAEVSDPADRRHRYAFACCTDCGPRFSVIGELPYDRERTSMAPFELCGACAAEYEDPADRRHHAQAVSCGACGPALSLQWADGKAIDGDPVDRERPNRQATQSTASDPIEAAASLLRSGCIVAIKGVGGYQLACRADDDDAVARLRRRKHREQKPFAVLVSTVEAAGRLAELDDVAAAALASPEAPIVLAPRRQGATETTAGPDAADHCREGAALADGVAPGSINAGDALDKTSMGAALADGVAPGSRLVGVMLPASPLHALLSAAVGAPVVCTSGNRSDEPIVTDDARAFHDLGDIADAVLSHDRDIERRADDSVGQAVAGRFRVPRRARGSAPRPVRLAAGGPPVLAVGAELKSTVCLAVGGEACVSVHLGDLEHEAALAAFETAVADLLALARTSPELVVHDLHPEYLSTKFAASSDLGPLLGVQHHHAHLAACLADARLPGPAVGVIFDGLGWGDDGTAWGGEVLVGDASGYERVARLRPVAMPGGTAAIREPWRMAVAHLVAAFGEDLAGLPDPIGDRLDVASRGGDTPCVPNRGSDTGGVVSDTRAATVNPLDVPDRGSHGEAVAAVVEACRPGRSIATTSMGRLFDAVAAMCGVGARVTYEGQAAIGLEQMAAGPDRRYPAELSDGSPAQIETTPLVEAVVADLRAGTDPAAVAGAFHRWVADAAVAASQHAREQTGLDVVALSGGVFQNRLLVELAAPALTQAGFRVLLHAQVPPNDGGISLGQAAIGRATLAAPG